jgi:hypothetical protein
MTTTLYIPLTILIFGQRLSNEMLSSIPLVRFEHIEDILLHLSETNEKNINELVNSLKKGRGVVSNAVAIILNLRLAKRSSINGSISLTPDGYEFARLLKVKDYERIKNLSSRLIIESGSLNEAYSLLRNNPKIDSYELGQKLHEKFGRRRNWNEKTYTSAGRYCKFLMDGLHLIPYEGGTATRAKKRHRDKLKNKIYPSASIESLLGIIRDNFKSSDEWKIINPNLISTRNDTLVTRTNTLVDLGLVEYINHENETVRLTTLGKKVKEVLDDPIHLSLVLQDVYIEYKPLADIISLLCDKKNDFNCTTVGEIVKQYNRGRMSDSTVRTYGLRLINWLYVGKIIDEGNTYGNYHITEQFLNRYENKLSTIPKKDSDDIVLVSKIKLKDYHEQNKMEIFQKIHRLCNWIIYSDDDGWDIKETIKTEIFKQFDMLITNQKGQNHILGQHAKHWVEQGYKTKDIDCIKRALQLVVHLDPENKLINST